MRLPNIRCLLGWTPYFVALLVLFYISSNLLISQSKIKAMDKQEVKNRIVKELEDNHKLIGHLTQAVLSTKTQTLKPGTHDNIDFPTFVDSNEPMGPGEGGGPVSVSKLNISSKEYQDGWSQHYFNEFVSKKISVHRFLPDCRSDVCKQHVHNFTGTLPALSVVVIFNNEAWTTLLRSVHSILTRTPDHLLKEVILVDDNSTLEHLGAPLNKYFSSFLKVRIIRSLRRVGLIRARLTGFEASVAPVVAFLDSHIECYPGWAESMLIRIAENPKAVVFPVIRTINDVTFEVNCNTNVNYYGTFEWKNLLFNWVSIPNRERKRRKNDSDPFRSPVMPGGIFAINREFFIKLGKYDPELGYWGGENMELSFKTWMCGGRLEMDTCSNVGHVFRKGTHIIGSRRDVARNAIRVAEVWMDDYKNYFFERNNYKLEDAGNVTDRILLRRSLGCKSFDWYLKNIFPEKTFPRDMLYAGEIRSIARLKCIESTGTAGDKPILHSCLGTGLTQVWYMGVTGQIQQDDLFICVLGGKVLLIPECSPTGPQWEYRKDKSLYHIPTGECLTAGTTDITITITPCCNCTQQQWVFQLRRTDLNFPKYS